jgi:hypothetical protein
MSVPQTKGIRPYVLSLLLTALIAALEYGLVPHRGTSLLMTLVFWTAIVEGCIAVAAICDMVNAKWIVTLREELLSPVPLLLSLTLLFALLGPKLDLYPWTKDQGRWLNRSFFLIRNVVILFLTYLAAVRYASLSRSGDAKKYRYAVIYLFFFVLSQSMVAFDWVMSLEYPWYSTLFGAYFFVEAIFCGLAVAGLLYLFRYGKGGSGKMPNTQEYLRDIGTLLFGFSILWGGFFFAQFLVIWYGNLPEEVFYLAERFATPRDQALSCLVIVSFFAVPFCFLLPRKAKITPFVIAIVCLSILSGTFVERYLFLKLILPLPAWIFIPELLLILALFAWQTGRRNDLTLPAPEHKKKIRPPC